DRCPWPCLCREYRTYVRVTVVDEMDALCANFSASSTGVNRLWKRCGRLSTGPWRACGERYASGSGSSAAGSSASASSASSACSAASSAASSSSGGSSSPSGATTTFRSATTSVKTSNGTV